MDICNTEGARMSRGHRQGSVYRWSWAFQNQTREQPYALQRRRGDYRERCEDTIVERPQHLTIPRLIIIIIYRQHRGIGLLFRAPAQSVPCKFHPHSSDHLVGGLNQGRLVSTGQQAINDRLVLRSSSRLTTCLTHLQFSLATRIQTSTTFVRCRITYGRRGNYRAQRAPLLFVLF